jgi:hypothetical protein
MRPRFKPELEIGASRWMRRALVIGSLVSMAVIPTVAGRIFQHQPALVRSRGAGVHLLSRFSTWELALIPKVLVWASTARIIGSASCALWFNTARSRVPNEIVCFWQVQVRG